MMNIAFFNLSFENVLNRYYLMMAIVIVAGFTGMWALGLLALPVFLSTIMGVSIKWEMKMEKEAKVKNLKSSKREIAA